ncbi:GNAT family N-acetyltransferase [Dactylosporangium sp. CS-047395]|uniref:GNAT family N-acetyltransferase n=1 Tax=Dactylosporangium sp. CS-047395 TaxID=3239936 RepID=UPI003D945F55
MPDDPQRSALPFPDPELTDGTVLLRPWQEQDTPQRYAAFSDELCQRFSWAGIEPITEAEVAAATVQNERDRLAGTSLNLAVADPADRARVWGAASVYDVDPGQSRASIGYWVAPWSRGRGVATRSLRLLAGWGFGALGVHRLELTCDPDNLASARVAEHCGFVREGRLRSHIRFKDGRRDTLVFSLLPGELR